MVWNNSKKNNLPPHDSEVLIKVNGAQYLSIFCAEQNHFRVNTEDQLRVFSPDQHEVHWSLVHAGVVKNKNTAIAPSSAERATVSPETLRSSFTIIIADDDADDQALMKRGLAE